MIFVEPEKRVRDQEIAHLAASIIKNERPPILMFALAGIHVLIEIGAVEFGQRVRVFRKMCRHPVHDDCDSRLMTFVDEVAQFVRCSVAAGRRIIICNLIPPGAFKRMLCDREQFDVGVTHLQHIGQQRLGQLEITQWPISFFRLPLPRTEVNFVNADRTLRPLFRTAPRHPIRIAPLISLQIVNQRRCRCSVLIKKRERIALEQKRAGLRPNLEFVMGAFLDARQK